MNTLIRHRAPFLVIMDQVALQAAFFLTYQLRYESGLFLEPFQPQYWPVSIGLSVFWFFTYLLTGMYVRHTSISRFEAIVETLKATTVGVIILFFLSMDPGHPVTGTRLVLFSYGFMILLMVGISRALFRTLIRSLYTRRIGLYRAVIFGCGDRAKRLYEQCRQQLEYGYDIKAVVSVGEEENTIADDLPVLSISEFQKALDSQSENERYEYALLALNSTENERTIEIIDLATRNHLRTMIEPDFMQILVGYAKTRELYGVPLLEVFPDLMTPTSRVIKRLMDFLVALVVLIIGSPFMVLVGFAVRLDSKGPAFYRQKRIGYLGREFTLYKFRTMRVDAEVETGAVWATPDDPRVTRFGRFLRKTRIDELPQALNVLVGDMSLVGPRPERKVFVEEFSQMIPFYTRRLNVKPGITGWAQIRQGYDTSIDDVREKLQYDLFYLENMSISLDFKILLNTLWVMVSAKGH